MIKKIILLLFTLNFYVFTHAESRGTSDIKTPEKSFNISENFKFSVKEIGPLISTKSAVSVISQGGNYSIPFKNQAKSLWVLSEIWIGEIDKDGSKSVHAISDNGAAVSHSTSAYDLKNAIEYLRDENGWPLSILSVDVYENPSVRRLWPRSGFQTGLPTDEQDAAHLQTGTTFYMFYSILQQYGQSPYESFRMGQGIAYSTSEEGPYIRVKHENSYALWNDLEPAVGSAVIEDEDGWIYAYGRVVTEPGKYSMTVARVQPGEIVLKDSYRYYSQDTSSAAWSTDVTDAALLFDNAPDELSVSYNEYMKLYLMAYSNPADGSALIRTSPYPWGKWSSPVKIISCKKEDYCYGAKEHSEFSMERGEIIYLTLEKKGIPYIYEVSIK
jgi:hypothetical protein